MKRTHDITGVDIVELLRVHGASPASRLVTLLALEGRDATVAQLRRVGAGDVVAVHTRARKWNDSGRGFLVYDFP